MQCRPPLFTFTLTTNSDLEQVAQEILEDNIVSLSRTMIDKEASMATTNGTSGHHNGSMDVDEL